MSIVNAPKEANKVPARTATGPTVTKVTSKDPTAEKKEKTKLLLKYGWRRYVRYLIYAVVLFRTTATCVYFFWYLMDIAVFWLLARVTDFLCFLGVALGVRASNRDMVIVASVILLLVMGMLIGFNVLSLKIVRGESHLGDGVLVKREAGYFSVLRLSQKTYVALLFVDMALCSLDFPLIVVSIFYALMLPATTRSGW